MNIDIRGSIKDNFKGSSKDEIKASVLASIESRDEVTLPGLGVFFEVLWDGCSDDDKEFILNILEKSFN